MQAQFFVQDKNSGMVVAFRYSIGPKPFEKTDSPHASTRGSLLHRRRCFGREGRVLGKAAEETIDGCRSRIQGIRRDVSPFVFKGHKKTTFFDLCTKKYAH
jgi:hypothetical protein